MSSSRGHKGEDAHPRPWGREGMHLFNRKTTHRGHNDPAQQEKGHGNGAGVQRERQKHPWIQPDGESGRSFFHPWHFVRICGRSSSHVSMWTNVLWPFTIAAMVLHFATHHPMWVFITAYIGMVPAANLLGFAGQELARKIPKVIGVIIETTFGSIVEIILFMVLIKGGEQNVPVIQAAILGSILANLLLCLGTYMADPQASRIANIRGRYLLLHRWYLSPTANFP